MPGACCGRWCAAGSAPCRPGATAWSTRATWRAASWPWPPGARAGQRYLLTGHNLTYRHLAKRAGRIAGNTGPIVTLPRWFLTGLGVTVEPLADLVGIAPPIAHDEAVTGASYLYFNASKAHRELGFRARPLDATLYDTLEWYRAAGLT